MIGVGEEIPELNSPLSEVSDSADSFDFEVEGLFEGSDDEEPEEAADNEESGFEVVGDVVDVVAVGDGSDPAVDGEESELACEGGVICPPPLISLCRERKPSMRLKPG